MKQILIRYSNFLILLVCVGIFFLTFDSKKLSTNVLDLFPKVEQRDLIDIHLELEAQNQLLLYTKDSVKELESLPNVNSLVKLKDNIYMLFFSKNVSVEDFYNDFIKVVDKIPDIRYFSADILRVENSNAIFSDVNLIMICSVIFLIILYVFILRIHFLSLNTIVTIISANLLGISVITTFYDNVNIMSLNFGVAIGNLAIDYMLHHHFFRMYMHRFKFNKSVFYGFITTFIGFFICLFIPFPLLSQLSVYAMVCLLVSYISFGFIYQIIGFKRPMFYKNIRKLRKPLIGNNLILILSVVFLLISIGNMNLDYNLEKLDYNNKKRIADQEFFKQELGDSKQVLLKGNSKEDLSTKAIEIAKVAQIKSDIRNLNIVEKNGVFYAKISLDSVDSIKNFDFVDVRSVKELSDEITNGIYKPMLVVLSIVIIVMIVIVLLITRSLISFSYTIAPLGIIFLYFLTTKVNIMHLFSLLIVVVSSIDYGIYVQKEGENIRTLHAIIFSALTTIAGFGFLSFSNILALKSFGLTISIGVITILLLLLFQKRSMQKGV
ncbi:hypothetical protein [Helicobacter sp. MIT 14-3879]|uniref:hypothetical protein n=1 Tax=Helicobacter sp. MIT 14-3879 TaxID=2040649 RepID=UPI000E1EB11D|nr:hypothetical protein [Helicobacter sp. MIT 14-3879]RDU65011.1 hypothetical protein CQA44_01490 [Helicobacter sp. MIT 14-3879]